MLLRGAKHFKAEGKAGLWEYFKNLGQKIARISMVPVAL
jgi:hypothetical protein